MPAPNAKLAQLQSLIDQQWLDLEDRMDEIKTLARYCEEGPEVDELPVQLARLVLGEIALRKASRKED